MADDLRTQVEQIMSAELSESELREQLEAVAAQDAEAFRNLADLWALDFYDRVKEYPDSAAHFLAQYVPANRPDLVETLLQRAEAKGQRAVFQELYQRVATPERWNADILALIANAPDYETIAHGVDFRQGQWATAAEATLIALYERDPDGFAKHFKDEMTFSSYRDLIKLPDGNLKNFRQTIKQLRGEINLYRQLFRRYATREEWHEAVREYLVSASLVDNVSHELMTRHPDDVSAEMDENLLQELINYFGEDLLMKYLSIRVNPFIRRRIDQIIAGNTDNARLLEAMQKLNNEIGSARFAYLWDYWAPRLYDRDPAFFTALIAQHAPQRKDAIPDLLPRIKADGHYDLFRTLYLHIVDPHQWNAEVLELARSDLPLPLLEREIDRIHVRADRDHWRMRHHLIIEDEPAAALYGRSPDAFREVIWRYLKEGQPYPLLRQAVEAADDSEFAQRLFRKTATPQDWQDEMQKLLDADIPADRILDELERRKPASIRGVDPAILGQFMAKYGEAVLPFFEHYIDWTAPERLRALLNLDIDRGDLLGELRAIARRQPREFAERADIWAVTLYERGADFFESFLTRYLTWNAKDTVRALLPRIEADGRDRLFSDLYRRAYDEEERYGDIERLLQAKMTDEALLAAIMRRSSRWSELPDRLAARLYQRNPAVFRDFVFEQINIYSWRNKTYNQLRRAAEERGDTEFVHKLQTKLEPQKVTQRDLQALLERDLTPEQVTAALEAVETDVNNVWDKNSHPLAIKLLEKYGDAVMPYFIRLAEWRGNWIRDWTKESQLLATVRRRANPTNYWQFIFALHDIHNWQQGLQELINSSMSDAEFRTELAMMTPEQERGWRRWKLDNKIALALYQRAPAISRPFLERFLTTAPSELFQLAEQNQDEDLLDFLTYLKLRETSQKFWNIRPDSREPHRNKPSADLQKSVDEMCAPVLARFDRLYADSPQKYVQRAANMLAYVAPFEFEFRNPEANRAFNPIHIYLTSQHREAWVSSREGIAALLESPNILVQIMGLDLLTQGGVDAAQRVIENLPWLRALLLGRARASTKRIALRCLEMAAQQDAESAAKIIPLLAETVNFVARRAISDDIAAAYVRLQG